MEVGLSHAEFWELTPDEVQMSIYAHLERERRIDWRFACLQAFMGNTLAPNKNRRLRPEDFMPKAVKPQTPEQHANILKAIANKVRSKHE